MTLLLLLNADGADAIPGTGLFPRTPIIAAPGALIDVVVRAGAGQLADLRVEVQDLDGATVVTAVAPLTEAPVDGGLADYTARLKVPDTLGSYLVVVSDLDGNTADMPLTVAGWRPTLADVGALLHARTIQEIGAPGGATEIGTFNTYTRPTGEQVDRLIDVAAADLASRAGVDIPAEWTRKAAHLAALQAAALVEASFFPNQLDSDRSAHRQYSAMYLSGAEQLVAAVRRPTALRLS